MHVQQAPAGAAEVAQQMMWLGIRLEGWLVIAAVILGPILALWAQRYSERRREERSRKLWLFRELMATRTIRLSGRHVEALNHIDLEFDPNKKADAKVLAAWKMYLDVLSDTPTEDAQRAARYEKREECFVDLMWEIGQHLGFSFDKIAIKRGAYSPIAHGELEDDQMLIRKGIVELLTGKRALSTLSWLMPSQDPLRITTEPSTTPARVVESPPAREQPLIDEANAPQTGSRGETVSSSTPPTGRTPLS